MRFKAFCQPLREAVSWNMMYASSTGIVYIVSLFVRLWVEIFVLCIKLVLSVSQPLREAVSWNTNALRPLRKMLRQPLREAVSWNVDPALGIMVPTGQPLREAVSWNFCKSCFHGSPSCQPLREAVSWNAVMGLTLFAEYIVSLFVRLWVEMTS